MAAVNMEITKLSDMEIAQMFSDYVGRMQDMERHTQAACKEADAFDVCCSSEFPQNIRLQNLMYEKMMNTAVEYEESGFIAGFKTAMALLSGQEELLPQPTQIPTPKEEKRVQEAVPASQTATKPLQGKFISTRQIGVIFGTPNWKVVKRIEKYIIPECNEAEKKSFCRCMENNDQSRPADVYRLDLLACRKYIQYMNKNKKFENVRNGLEKFKEVMQETFCSACVA